MWDYGMCADTSRGAAIRDLIAEALKGPLAPQQQERKMSVKEYDIKFKSLSWFVPWARADTHEAAIKFQEALKLSIRKHVATFRFQRYSDIRNLTCVVEREEEEQNKQRERGKGSNPCAKKQQSSTCGTTPTPKGVYFHCGQWGHRNIECPQLIGQLVGQIAEQAHGQMPA
ncbi:hypothetical protein ACLOJK_028493 [Asimina triloba]